MTDELPSVQGNEPKLPLITPFEQPKNMSLEHAWEVLKIASQVDPNLIAEKADLTKFGDYRGAIRRVAADILLHPSSTHFTEPHFQNGTPLTETRWEASEEIPLKPGEDSVGNFPFYRTHRLAFKYVDMKATANVLYHEGIRRLQMSHIPIAGNEQVISTDFPGEIIYEQRDSGDRPTLKMHIHRLIPEGTSTETDRYARRHPELTMHASWQLSRFENLRLDTFYLRPNFSNDPPDQLYVYMDPEKIDDWEVKVNRYRARERFYPIALGIKEMTRVLYNRSSQFAGQSALLPPPENFYHSFRVDKYFI